MRTILTLSTIALLAACTRTPAETAAAAQAGLATQAALDKELAGLVPGKPQQCLGQFRTQQMIGYGPTIVYKVSGALKYRSDTAGGCERIGRGDILVTRSYTGQLCSGDIAQTFDPASRFPTGSCSLGSFTPYRKPS